MQKAAPRIHFECLCGQDFVTFAGLLTHHRTAHAHAPVRSSAPQGSYAILPVSNDPSIRPTVPVLLLSERLHA